MARALLARGFTVRVLLPDASGERARALRRAGAEPVTGSLADRASLRAALAACWGVFGSAGAGEVSGSAGEPVRNLLRAAAGSDVEHFVLSLLSEAGGPVESGAAGPGAEALEAYARSLGLPATYLRVTPPFAGEVGELVATIFERPGPFVDRTLAWPAETAPAECGRAGLA